MKLAQWARENNIHPRTAERWFHKGQLPVKAIQLPTGTILIQEESISKEKKQLKVVTYSRVSTHDQKNDLLRQTERLKNFCAKEGFVIFNSYEEVASGMNDKRKKLNKILADKTIDIIVVEHKDRLTRFGFEMLVSSLKAQNRKIIVINESDIKEDLVQDFVDVITSMCSRIYGKRSSKNRKERILKEVIKDE